MTDKKSDLVARLWQAHERGGFEPRIFEEAASALRDLEIENQGFADVIAKDVANKLQGSLTKMLDLMEVALAFYADSGNYHGCGAELISPVEQDGGELARSVLSKYRGHDNEATPSSDPQKSSA